MKKLIPYILALDNFSRNIPQEKVYLQFDYTSYYHGDQIWFKCYVVTSGQHQLSPWSKTLYVELLNPGGEIVDKGEDVFSYAPSGCRRNDVAEIEYSGR